MALQSYDGSVKGDRLSPVLLHDISKQIGDESGLYLAPNPIVLGLNSPNTYKVVLKFYNPLTCPIILNDIQLLMCPVLAQSPVKYYNDNILSSIPASTVSIRVDAYTNVVKADNVENFELAASSNTIELSALSTSNASHQHISGLTDAQGYKTQFGSLGVFYNDSAKRLNPVTIAFSDGLVLQSRKSCYFVFEVVSSSNNSGGFAVSAPVDFRAVNFTTTKSSGVLKRISNIWRSESLYRRINGQWVKDVLPSYVRDVLSIFYPYNPNGTPEEPEPPEPGDIPDVLYDGANWYISTIISDNVEMNWYGVAGLHDDTGERYLTIVTDNSQGPKFTLDVTEISQVRVSAYLVAGASTDGYSEMQFAVSVSNITEKQKVVVNKLNSMESGSVSKSCELVVNTSTLSGVQTISMNIGDYDGTGSNLAHYRYNCTGSARVLKIEVVK